MESIAAARSTNSFGRPRRRTRQVRVGNIPVGGDAPVCLQSMTSTYTHDIDATVGQINRLAGAGCDAVRVAVPDQRDTAALREILRQVSVPIIADVHFHFQRALEAIEAGVHKIRLNPGNIKDRKQVNEVIRACRDAGIPIRVGVNEGSIVERQDKSTRAAEKSELAADQHGNLVRLMVRKLEEYIRIFEENDFYDVVLSAKSIDATVVIDAYRAISERFDFPLHLGVTHAGPPETGRIRSIAALGTLLAEGIGDTIRVSLTPRPGGDRREEVYAACELLQALGLRSFAPSVTACPGCGRTTSNTFQELAERVQGYVRERLPHWKAQYEGVETLTLAVMGCVVNGPGESRAANIGISLPGTGEAPACPVYVDGVKHATFKGTPEELAGQFKALIEEYVATRYPRRPPAG